MNDKQLEHAMSSMIRWLEHPSELGMPPKKIVCAGTFIYNAKKYYIFKFKTSLFGKWMLGVCGGYDGNSLENCGHVFSEFHEYSEKTAQQECIIIIEKIMAYWKKMAENYLNQQNKS